MPRWSGRGLVAHPVFKTGRPWQPHGWKVRFLRCSVSKIDGVSSRTVVDDLAASISAAILDGELEAGSRLGQEALAERFGVSRQPVREALRRLQAEGLVQVHPRRGMLVRQLAAREVR
ncbi:MAG: hypothetical protein QOD13_3449, partial [Thermoleophilaceae bacterium]|nr:hypothetical protein [Thermoleophilaceae bacterium]